MREVMPGPGIGRSDQQDDTAGPLSKAIRNLWLSTFENE